MIRALGLSLAAALCCAAAASPASAAVLTIDDFEGYANNFAVAPGASSTSTPWLRSGAINDNLVATTNVDVVLAGAVSGRIPLGAGAANVRRNYGTAAQDFSGYATASVLTRSLAATASTATVQLSIATATSSFISTVGQAESTAPQTLTFSLDAASFTRAAGTESFAAVLSGATSIGFRIVTTASESIVLDNFALATAVPEPATLGVAGAAVATLLRRRRRA